MLGSSFCLDDAQFATRPEKITKGQARPIDLRKTCTKLTNLLFREIQMTRYTKVFTFLVLAAALCLSTPSIGHADTILAYQLDGGAPVIVATGGSLTSQSVSFSVAGIDVVFLTSSEINSALGSSIASASTRVTNNSAVSHTLSLFATSQDFTLPVGPNLRSSSGAGGTYLGATAVGVTFQAYASATNTAFGIAFTNGLQAAVPPSGTTGTFATGEVTGTFVRGAGNYSLTIVSNLTLAAGSSVNYSSHETMTQISTPEPAALSLLGLGLIGFAVGKRRLAHRMR